MKPRTRLTAKQIACIRELVLRGGTPDRGEIVSLCDLAFRAVDQFDPNPLVDALSQLNATVGGKVNTPLVAEQTIKGPAAPSPVEEVKNFAKEHWNAPHDWRARKFHEIALDLARRLEEALKENRQADDDMLRERDFWKKRAEAAEAREQEHIALLRDADSAIVHFACMRLSSEHDSISNPETRSKELQELMEWRDKAIIKAREVLNRIRAELGKEGG